MHCFTPASIPARLLLVSVLGLAPTQVRAQSGTAQVPVYSSDAESTKPAAVQRAPAQRLPPPQHATSVVHPHGHILPAKPPERQELQEPHTPLPLPLLRPPTGSPTAAPEIAPAPPTPTKQGATEKVVGTVLPLPRFAALRSDDVNLRAGPGPRYPIEWIYKRRDLPMEIERQFEVWRLVKDPDGIRGWVHQAALTARRTFVVQGADATLRAEPEEAAGPVAILKVGVIGRIQLCKAGNDWCRMQVGEYRGFLKRSQFWGALPGEGIAP